MISLHPCLRGQDDGKEEGPYPLSRPQVCGSNSVDLYKFRAQAADSNEPVLHARGRVRSHARIDDRRVHSRSDPPQTPAQMRPVTLKTTGKQNDLVSIS